MEHAHSDPICVGVVVESIGQLEDQTQKCEREQHGDQDTRLDSAIQQISTESIFFNITF